MKAYIAWDEYNSEGYSTVVFAESASKALLCARAKQPHEERTVLRLSPLPPL